jgi:mannose-6-phosphate isomerase
MRIYRLENPIQHFSWGSLDGITQALGVPNPQGGHFAELWMGAHPIAPSKVEVDGQKLGLDVIISRDPAGCLGKRCVERFGDELPFLFKALSAESPLSIQAHPGKRKAELGFERENLSGVPLDAPERNYRDPNHKPEASVALTRLELLCGFRPLPEFLGIVHLLGGSKFKKHFERLERNPGRLELSVLFYGVVSVEESARTELLAHTRERTSRLLESDGLPEHEEPALRWVLRLMDLFPGDIGALAPLMLNLVTVEPGQSVFIAPGEPHAYLSGTCLEIMANSDNVIRGALTRKHVDLPELVSVLSFNPERVVPVPPEIPAAGSGSSPPGTGVEEFYPIFVPDFQLSRLRLARDSSWSRASSGPDILLCVKGEADLAGSGGECLRLSRGETAFVRADAGAYRASSESEGGAILYRASVPEIP